MVVTTLVIAFILQSKELVLAQSVIFLLTVWSINLSPFVLFYRYVLKPLNVLKNDYRKDNIRAHRFAFMIGSAVSSLSVISLYLGSDGLGWSLVAIIIVLGSIAVAGWCAGCYSYYMLNKLGFKGYFSDCPVDTSFPGMRPQKDKRKIGNSSLKLDDAV